MTATDSRPVPATQPTAWRSPGQRFSIRLRHRPLRTSLLLAVIALLLGFASLCWGGTLGIGEVLGTLFGFGDQTAEFVVFEFRLPRVLAALVVGACLGVAGAQFQTLTRNPLGSPDIIGLTQGAATGAVLVLLLFGEENVAVPLGAIVVGLLTAALMYLLAWRRGAPGMRLVLIGVAVSAILESVTAYLLIQADIFEAQAAHVWLVGSLAATTWSELTLLLVGAAVLLPLAGLLIRPLDQLSLGDEAARGVGVRVERTRLGVTATAVGLAAVSVAAVGPIAFVALAAPQLARRLAASPGAAVVPSALMGAALLAAADIVARLLPLPSQPPVGVVTGGLGGCYLAWLLWREHRS